MSLATCSICQSRVQPLVFLSTSIKINFYQDTLDQDRKQAWCDLCFYGVHNCRGARLIWIMQKEKSFLLQFQTWRIRVVHWKNGKIQLEYFQTTWESMHVSFLIEENFYANIYIYGQRLLNMFFTSLMDFIMGECLHFYFILWVYRRTLTCAYDTFEKHVIKLGCYPINWFNERWIFCNHTIQNVPCAKTFLFIFLFSKHNVQ